MIRPGGSPRQAARSRGPGRCSRSKAAFRRSARSLVRRKLKGRLGRGAVPSRRQADGGSPIRLRTSDDRPRQGRRRRRTLPECCPSRAPRALGLWSLPAEHRSGSGRTGLFRLRPRHSGRLPDILLSGRISGIRCRSAGVEKSCIPNGLRSSKGAGRQVRAECPFQAGQPRRHPIQPANRPQREASEEIGLDSAERPPRNSLNAWLPGEAREDRDQCQSVWFRIGQGCSPLRH